MKGAKMMVKSRRLAVVLFSMVLLTIGCSGVKSTVQVREVGETTFHLGSDEAVAILTPSSSVIKQTTLEGDAVGCIGDVLRAARPKVWVITPEEFRKTVFAYRLPEEETEQQKYLALLMTQPVLREQMASLGIRYLILVRGSTKMEKKWSEGAGGATGSGIGFVGATAWDRQSRLTALVLDLKLASSIGEIQASASGTPWLAYMGPIPPFGVGVPAFTETEACKKMGEGIVNFLTGKDLAKPSQEEPHE